MLLVVIMNKPLVLSFYVAGVVIQTSKNANTYKALFKGSPVPV